MNGRTNDELEARLKAGLDGLARAVPVEARSTSGPGDRRPTLRARPALSLGSVVAVLAVAAAVAILGRGGTAGAPAATGGEHTPGATQGCSSATESHVPGEAPMCSAPPQTSEAPTATSGTPRPTSAPTPAITKEQAIAAAEAFVGRTLVSPTVDGPMSWPGGIYWSVMDTGPSGVGLWVDAIAGNVIEYAAAVADDPSVRITAAQAQAAAAAFMTVHGVSFAGLTPTVELNDHGAFQEYEVTYQRYVDGVLVPDTRLLGVSAATGEVYSFMDRRVAYGTVPAPVVTKDEAIAAAVERSGLTAPTVEDATLMIASGPLWTGRLVWQVTLHGEVPIDSQEAYTSAWIVYVDAVTGEVTVAGQG